MGPPALLLRSGSNDLGTGDVGVACAAGGTGDDGVAFMKPNADPGTALAAAGCLDRYK